MKLLLLKRVCSRTALDLLTDKSGMYLKVSVEDKELKMLIDTGSSTIILSDKAFNKLSQIYRKDREEYILNANGSKGGPYPIMHNIVYTVGNQQILGYAAIVPAGKNIWYDGIIGLPMLRLLKASIDIENSKLYISGNENNRDI